MDRVLWGNEHRDSFVDALEARQRDHPQCHGLTMVPYDLTIYDEGAPPFRRFLRIYLATSLEVLNGSRGEDWEPSMYDALLECFLNEEVKSARALKHLLLADDYLYPSDDSPSARDAILAAGKAPNLTTLLIYDIYELDAPALEELCAMLNTNRWPFLKNLTIKPYILSSLQAHKRLVDAMVGSSHGFPYLRVLRIGIEVDQDFDGENDQTGGTAAATPEETLARLLQAPDKFPALRENM